MEFLWDLNKILEKIRPLVETFIQKRLQGLSPTCAYLQNIYNRKQHGKYNEALQRS